MSQPDVSTLRRLRTLSQFSDAQLQSLSADLSIGIAPGKKRLIERGCIEQFSFYLLDGEVTTIANDCKKQTVESKVEGDLSPIAQLRPSLYDVDAVSEVRFLKIYANQLTRFAQQLEDDDSISLVTIEQSSEENELTIQLFQDIMSGKLNLPSLPDVAHRIQKAFSKDDIDAEEVAQIVQADPSIAAKLIMIANSALYHGLSPIDTLQQAIVRMGLETTRKQVITYVVKELFAKTTADVKSKMQDVWTHCRRVAAFSRILAKQTQLFDPEQAQLAGLVHDLGEIAIHQYAQEHLELYDNDEKLMQAIRCLRPQITGMLLHKWNFTGEMITVGEEPEDWFRNPQDTADLCDLVMIAQYHSFIGTPEMHNLPPISKMPAFAKLGLKTEKLPEILAFVKASQAEAGTIERSLGSL
jgi:HD-like signal output (HDOD) protein